MASGYENSEGLPETRANVVTEAGSYSYAKYGRSDEPFKGSCSSNMDAIVDNNPIYCETTGKPLANPLPPCHPSPPQLPPSNPQHYNVPSSNKSLLYERMDSFQRVQSPNDPVRPLVDHESTPIIDEEPMHRVSAENPVYNSSERGNSEKRTYRGTTEPPVEEYNSKVRPASRCDSKAFMMCLLMLILFIMSAASLILSILVIITPVGCGQCSAGSPSVVTPETLQTAQQSWRSSLLEMNQSFTDLVSLNQGPPGPPGVNGSRGPDGPSVIEGSVNLKASCSERSVSCSLSTASDNVECTTAGLVPDDDPNVFSISEGCTVRTVGDSASFTVNSAVVHTSNSILGESPKCTCSINLAGGLASCQFKRLDCNFSAVQVALTYDN